MPMFRNVQMNENTYKLHNLQYFKHGISLGKREIRALKNVPDF